MHETSSTERLCDSFSASALCEAPQITIEVILLARSISAGRTSPIRHDQMH